MGKHNGKSYPSGGEVPIVQPDGRVAIAMAMMVPADQAHIDTIRVRSHELAVQRGHIMRAN